MAMIAGNRATRVSTGHYVWAGIGGVLLAIEFVLVARWITSDWWRSVPSGPDKPPVDEIDP